MVGQSVVAGRRSLLAFEVSDEQPSHFQDSAQYLRDSWRASVREEYAHREMSAAEMATAKRGLKALLVCIAVSSVVFFFIGRASK